MGDVDHPFRQAGEIGTGDVDDRFDDQRQDHAMFGLHIGPAAGQARQVGLGPGGRRGQGIGAGLHLRLDPGDAAAREHAVIDIFRDLVTRHRHLAPGGAHLGHRHLRGAQDQPKFLGRPALHRRQRLCRGFGHLGRHRKGGTIAAEHEGKIAPVGAGDLRRDHRGADHVDGFVLPPGNCLGRSLDIGGADHPVLRQRCIAVGARQRIEIGQPRQAVIKPGYVATRSHTRP